MAILTAGASNIPAVDPLSNKSTPTQTHRGAMAMD